MGKQRIRLLHMLVLAAATLTGPTWAVAASVSNVKMVEENGQYVITYDLEAAEPTPVLLMGSEDGGKKYDIRMEFATGDVGDQVNPGRGKKIVWNAKKDFPKGTGSLDLSIDVIVGQRSSSLQEITAGKPVQPNRSNADNNQEKTRTSIEQRKKELEELQQQERLARTELSKFDGLSSPSEKQQKEKQGSLDKLNAILKKEDAVRSNIRQLEKEMKDVGAERKP